MFSNQETCAAKCGHACLVIKRPVLQSVGTHVVVIKRPVLQSAGTHVKSSFFFNEQLITVKTQ